jgi:hypothetical protein
MKLTTAQLDRACGVLLGRQRLTAGRGELDIGLGEPEAPGSGGGSCPSPRRGRDTLCDPPSRACDTLGFEQAAGVDELFWQIVVSPIIEPV